MVGHCIIYTRRADGGVRILYPAPECVQLLMSGGGLDCSVRGRVGLYEFLRTDCGYSASALVTAYAEDHIDEDVAARWERHKFLTDPMWQPPGDREAILTEWINGLRYGGLSYDDAIRLIARKDHPSDGIAMEIVRREAINSDRWFRNAWRRSANGGPIYIDMDRARVAQKERIAIASMLDDRGIWDRVTAPLPPIDWSKISREVEAAACLEDLRRVHFGQTVAWPEQSVTH